LLDYLDYHAVSSCSATTTTFQVRIRHRRISHIHTIYLFTGRPNPRRNHKNPLPLFYIMTNALVERGVHVTVTYKSENIGFSEWISLSTLCLAPLLAHVYVGTPEYAMFSVPRPKWHDRITHLNPTSIFWRYYVIANRRARSKSWTPSDMAIANTAFWRDGRWIGSEDIIPMAKELLVLKPERTRISILSKSAAETVVVTLQGVQAVWDLCSVLPSLNYGQSIALPTIFSPLAIFGLLRLLVALWITEEVSYREEAVLSSSLRY
jgi:hypothetical protein